MKDVSIIITAHHEGKIAHKTMLSIFSCIEKIEKNFSYEIIIHIDNGDKKTIDYFNKYKNNKKITIYNNNFGDPGMSRNFAIEQASGKFISILDADDLVSDNWLSEALKILVNAKHETVVHPSANLTFEFGSSKHVLWIQKNTLNLEDDTYYLAGFNRWASVAVGERKTFLNFPYPKSGNGFGHEDYWFNTETTAANICHIVAPGTIEFYRRKQESILTKNNTSNVVIKPTTLFQPDKIRKFYKQETRDKKRNVGKIARYINKIKTHVSYKHCQHQNIPEYVLNEWRKINEIEPQLYPTNEDINETLFYSSEDNQRIGKTFCDLASKIYKIPDYVFIVPWVVHGGADKLLLNYINAIKEVYPSWNLLVISTLPANNTWRNKIPNDVQYIDFGNTVVNLSEYEKNEVFSLLISQIGVKKMHVINSDFAYKWIAKHREYVDNNLIIYTSAFSYIYTDKNRSRLFSYLDPDVLEINESVKRIFTDNKAVVTQAIDRSGFKEEQFRVHHQPYLGRIEHKSVQHPDDKIHILWASRIAATKCPELLCEIAKKLPRNKYSIDVYGKIETAEGYTKNIFSGIKTIHYKGEYNNFSDIPTEKYDIFLYTSNSDGVPNVLLEAIAAGLPIFASNVGGVGEIIIDKKTGFLIKSDKATEYVEEIKKECSNNEKMLNVAEEAQKLLQLEYSWENFIESVRRDIK